MVEDLSAATIGQIALTVGDIDEARAFYRDRLGLTHLFDAPPAMAFFQCGDVRLMLSQGDAPGETPPTTLVYFRIADIEAVHRSLTGRGVDFVREPTAQPGAPGTTLWLAFLRDPAGNTLGLIEERAGQITP